MKTLMLCASVLLAYAAPVSAAESRACAIKRSDIENQISEAQARGQSQELRGLQRALKANLAKCTDASLARERDDRIAKAQREVVERERDLLEAERKGDTGKLASRRAKLEEARSELAEAQKPLQR